MRFYDLCYVAKGARITVRVRDGDKWKYFPESFLQPKELDLTGRQWIIRKGQSEPFLNMYVTSIEPTAHNYMTVTLA